MTSFVLGFLVGAAWLQQQPALPPIPLLLGVGLLALAGGAGLYGRGRGMGQSLGWFVVAAALSVSWGGWRAQLRLADTLPSEWEGRDMQVEGVISGLPQQFENGWRFEFAPESAEGPVPGKLLLAWYRSHQLDEWGEEIQPLPVRAGERWRFTVRLKRPHTTLNPHGYDYEAWLFEQGIRATGYIRPRSEAIRLGEGAGGVGVWVESVRQTIRDRFLRRLGDAPYAGILVALAIGDQRLIPANQWLAFSRTGLTHLLSVSGLHITLFSGLSYGLLAWGWRRSFGTDWQLPLRWPTARAATLAGLLGALVYAALSGFSVPAQRTVYMVAVAGLAVLSGRSIPVRHVLGLALLGVLVLDPWAVTAAGFWLSYGAVAFLLYTGYRQQAGRGTWRRALAGWRRAQWAMLLGMLPLTLAWFQQFSLVAPLSNAVGIPLVSFVVTPLVLLATLPGLDILLLPAEWVTAGFMAGVNWLAGSGAAVWQQAAPSTWGLAAALVGVVLILAPRGFPARRLGGVLCLPLFLLGPERPATGGVRLTVLDVGQGLAVHVQTAQHDLVFDTGPAYSPEANSGNRILIPYLRAEGVRRLDALVLSHADKDHSGGAAAVLAEVPVARLHHALPGSHPLLQGGIPAAPCIRGEAWQWDGVSFSFLHPPASQHEQATAKTNDMSCVLRIQAGEQVALVTADIEARSERLILAHAPLALRADVLLAPHHGSGTSSTTEFVAAVGARWVAFPLGYRNRFHHPKAEVWARYEATGAHLLRSDRSGAMVFDLSPGLPVQLRESRVEQRRYWHDS